MPRAPKESTLSRQWEMMRLVPAQLPGKTSRQLQEQLRDAGFEVSKRTVERDLVELSGIFPLLCNERSAPYGWHWEADARLTIPGMDLAEAVSLGLLEDLLRQLVPPSFYRALEGRFAEAREKLTHLAGNPHARWSEMVRYLPPGIPFLPPEVAPRLLREIQDALLRGKQLLVEYSAAGEDTSREILLHPLALIQQGVRPYLLATTFHYDIPCNYALHRMISAVVQDELASKPEGFTLDRHLARSGGQFGTRGFLSLKAKLSPDLAAILEETPVSDDQKITQWRGEHRLSATMADSWQLRYWILSQGPDIVIKEPASLRHEIAERVQETLRHYEK